MTHKVLKKFHFGADGIHAIEFTPESPVTDFGTATEGLEAEGYIVRAKVETAKVEAPVVGEPVEAAVDLEIETTANVNTYKSRKSGNK